jgi:hypothetical protein
LELGKGAEQGIQKQEICTSGNAINGVSPNNPNAEKYINAAKTEFGEL